MDRPIVVIGAGLAGLVCARRLYRYGHDVLVLDADDRPGGRMKTDLVDGFRLDRGFQVYFDQYPYTEAELNEEALCLQPFEPGALVVWDGKREEVNRDMPLHMAFSGFLPLNDKLRTLGLSAELKGMDDEDIWRMPDDTAVNFLRAHGFSDTFLAKFARPFFGGVFLDRSLQESARMFAFVWKMMNEGRTTVPALGMEEIPKQVAADIPVRCFRFGVRVDSLATESGKVSGVRLASGEVIEAGQVVVATDAATAERLTGTATGVTFKGSTTIPHPPNDRPTDQPMLVVNGNQGGQVNHVAVMSRVSTAYGDGKHHLISATILGDAVGTDDQIAAEARYEVKSWCPELQTSQWRPLRVDRIAHAQMVQPPGFHDHRPGPTTSTEGVYLAGEYTTYSGIDGAVLSGRRAADALMAANSVPV